jgi:hypothetical protein
MKTTKSPCKGPIRDAQASLSEAADAVTAAAAAVVKTADAATNILTRINGWLDRLEKLLP